MGAVVEIAKGLSFYARAGYEWVGRAHVSTGGSKAAVDHSSLVVTAGLIYRF